MHGWTLQTIHRLKWNETTTYVCVNPQHTKVESVQHSYPPDGLSKIINEKNYKRLSDIFLALPMLLHINDLIGLEHAFVLYEQLLGSKCMPDIFYFYESSRMAMNYSSGRHLNPKWLTNRVSSVYLRHVSPSFDNPCKQNCNLFLPLWKARLEIFPHAYFPTFVLNNKFVFMWAHYT